jgi:acetylglutamate kinase
MDKLYIIKIGGNIVDDSAKLAAFLQSFALLQGNKILIHGGGKLATRVAEGMGIEQQMVDGRRITDAETLKVVTMVYAGHINKSIVAALQQHGCNAAGLTGVDGNFIQAAKRPLKNGVDYGFVGDVEQVNAMLVKDLLQRGITHDGKGQLLNTNADTIAQEVAKALSAFYETALIYSFEKPGVLLNAEDDSTVIPVINAAYYTELKEKQLVFAGMLPKLDNAFAAIDSGVRKVIIGKAEELPLLISGNAGTQIIHD